MWGFVIAAIALWLLVKLIKSFFKEPVEPAQAQPAIDYNLDLEDEYSIKGINKSGIDDRYLGSFQGTAVALRDNKYDPYAVAIVINGKRIGWLPAGSVGAHVAIMEQGGTAKVYGYIAKATDEDNGHEFYYGKVRIDA